MDENIDGAITRGVRHRGVDVLTVQEDKMRGQSDPKVLDRATLLGRVAVTEDDDFLAEAARRQEQGKPFGGVIFAPKHLAIGLCVETLELIALANEAENYAGRVTYLPLK